MFSVAAVASQRLLIMQSRWSVHDDRPHNIARRQISSAVEHNKEFLSEWMLKNRPVLFTVQLQGRNLIAHVGVHNDRFRDDAAVFDRQNAIVSDRSPWNDHSLIGSR